MNRYAKNLLIVESPAKVKTISKILGNDFVVKASFGHIRDLPKNELGFDPDNKFQPTYKIYPDKQKVVRELKSYINNNTTIWLASDDDAEGEAIAWHLQQTLGNKNNTYNRIVFHEITKPAILNAVENPGNVDINKVNMQQARRILDRAVGYKLSPLLWKKIKYGLSAGRVQSVALRIVADREEEIEKFIPEEFWKLKLDILSNPQFKAELSKIDGKVKKVKSKDEAYAIKDNCDKNDYILNDIEEKDSYRNPPPPFTTSTLQQEASRKNGFGVKLTMSVAQKLYEGNMSIPNHTGGLITYMRTDSVNLSKLATVQAKEVITKEYGNEYTLAEPRRYKAKGNAQEAHEAIRPTNMNLKPSIIKPYLTDQEYKLYSLIWKRTMATQMVSAKVATTTYKILGGSNKQYEYISKGTKILFPGFMLAYTEGQDDDSAIDNSEKFLPNVSKGTVFKETKLVAEQNFTKPPSRYTEASLVKRMESLGVGRPSTYASTISTIINRGYVEKEKDKKLIPTVIGKVVNKYLKEHFADIVNYKFTAKMEENLDRIAKGEVEWYDVLKDFYFDFVKKVEENEGTDRVQYSSAEVLGKDPKTGLDVTLRYGQYGSYVQIGESDKEKKIKAKVAPVPKGKQATDVTLEDALKYLELPRELGKKDGTYIIKAGIGRFGPFLLCNNKYYSFRDISPYDVTLEQALEIIKEKDEADKKALINEFPKDNIKILNGRYGIYIRQGKKNYKISKDLSEDELRKLTLEDVKKIIKNQPNTKKKTKRSK